MKLLIKVIGFFKSLFKSEASAEIEKEPEEVVAEPAIEDNIDLVAEKHCEELICKKCGKEYYSSGLHDIGLCKECLAKENLIGGPLGK